VGAAAGPGGLTKYVDGRRVGAAWFAHKYQQGENYQIKISYSPSSTSVEAFGETLTISTDNSAIDVDSFSVRTKAQNACYDNILTTLTATPPGNTPPVANAGSNQNVLTGATVTLDGSGSHDADGDTLSYLWTMTSKPSGSSAALSDPTAKKPSFTADKNGDYIIRLVVNDGSADSAPDTVKVTTVGDIAFFDDFSNDTTGDYTQGGSGTFTYDSANERACVTPTGAGKSFSHDLSPASDTGTFSIDVSTLQRTGSEGEIEVRLYDNAGNYYKIINRSGKSRTGGLSKYVSGIRVSSAWFNHQYAQNSDYQIKVTYAPNTTKVEAFGETLIINNDHSPIEVSSFTVRTKAQKACYDNIAYTAETASPQGSITIDNAALKKFIASTYDNTPYNPPIDIQGVIDAGGMTVTVPYTVTAAPTTLEAYSTSVTLDASVTQDGESGIVATFAWAEQTDLPVGSGTFTATITIDDSAGNNDGIYKAKQLDIEDDSAGLVAATFSYPTDSVGATGVLTLKIVAGIPDRMFGLPDNNGDDTTHNFLYLPVTNTTTGKTWLNNNLGANYANVNDPAFNLTQQATASNDYNAYGSLFQWGRKADGHELINWISGSEGAGVNGVTGTKSDDPSDALFITEGDSPYDWRVTQDDTLWANEASINNVCPVGYRLPTGGSGGELDLERQSWGSNNAAGALGSELKLPMPGYRTSSNGTVSDEGTYGRYWGSTVSGTYAQVLGFDGSNASMNGAYRANGFTVRCLKDDVAAPSTMDTWVYGATEEDATRDNSQSEGLLGSPESNCNTAMLRAYIYFDISEYPDPDDVVSVVFGVTHTPQNTCYSNCSADFYFYPVLESWQDNTLNYNNMPSEGNPEVGPIHINVPNDFGHKEYDITELYKKWKDGTLANYGISIHSPTVGCNNASAGFYIYSLEASDPDNRPYIKIITNNNPN